MRKQSMPKLESLSFEHWRESFLEAVREHDKQQWKIGDIWASGEHLYGQRKAMVESDDWTGPSFQACADAASVCRAFETSRRREHLSFTHHREVMGLAVEFQEKLLDEAERDGLSIRALRERVREFGEPQPESRNVHTFPAARSGPMKVNYTIQEIGRSGPITIRQTTIRPLVEYPALVSDPEPVAAAPSVPLRPPPPDRVENALTEIGTILQRLTLFSHLTTKEREELSAGLRRLMQVNQL